MQEILEFSQVLHRYVCRRILEYFLVNLKKKFFLPAKVEVYFALNLPTTSNKRDFCEELYGSSYLKHEN